MKNKTKHTLDFVMSVMLLFLMAHQVTGEKAHEWLGIVMFVMVAAHNLLNLKWYSVLFKGRYPFLRIIRTVANVLLLVAMLGTMISGILLNSYIFPLSIHSTMAVARVLHLAGSYWCFVLMGIAKGTLPIIGVTKAEQVEDAVKAAALELTANEIKELEDVAEQMKLNVIRYWEKEMK